MSGCYLFELCLVTLKPHFDVPMDNSLPKSSLAYQRNVLFEYQTPQPDCFELKSRLTLMLDYGFYAR